MSGTGERWVTYTPDRTGTPPLYVAEVPDGLLAEIA
jgi:hypothetical protein